MAKSVQKYIEKQKSPQRENALRLREIIFETFPQITEEMKYGAPWYEGKYYIFALRDHVNLGFSLDNLPPEAQKLLEGSGKTMKHLKFYSIDDIDKNKSKIVEMLKLA